MIGDVLTQGMKVVDHALHPVIVVVDVEVALLQGAELGVELQNKRLDVDEELSLSREPCLVCSLCRFPNDLEGPEKATRGGVNGSQSKFLTGTWPMS
jgi:hypothetical protein